MGRTAQSTSTRKDGTGYVWLLLAGAVALAVLAFSNLYIIDDAYISFRYSHNLVEGHGLVFNEGEYVEGYTNLLWTLLMAVPDPFGIPVHLFAAYAGLAFGLLAMVEAWRILGILGVSGWPRGFAVVTLGAYPEFWRSATMGLEGGLFAFLLALAARLLFSGKNAWAGVAGGLMFATRPESLLLVAVFALYALFSPRRRAFVRTLRLVFPWLGLVAAVTLWRLYYYGAWLPNTIAAKSPPEYDLARMLENFSFGTEYLVGFAFFAAPLVLGALSALILGYRDRAAWLCFGAFAAEIPPVLVNGGDWMPYHRLLSVYVPLFAVLLGMALSRIAVSRQPVARIGVGLVLLAGGVFMLYDDRWAPTPDAHVSANPSPCWHGLARAVEPALLPTDKVGSEAIGIFGYTLEDTYVLDYLGLTDYLSAHHGTFYSRGFGKFSPERTYDARPSIIFTHSGFFIFKRLVDATEGAYNEEYSTYKLTEVPDCDEEGGGKYGMMASIRNDSVVRMLPALAPLGPKRVEVQKTGR